MSLQTQPNGSVISVTRKRSPEEIIEFQKQKIAGLETENADLKGRVSDMELAFADLITGGGV
ncbi:hypothetical protein FE783_12600 [Paenibacillus mesophilus]|uniref:hypothetical protein n=1 Tax=Paenibacillus mesophilus TaxID=2582849 RepID=UPI00110F3F65|nr:hypothetical protein [Paenibacillus mesophilus]TMV49349.1 hypothetical protein FE783_12600 [Paenibacillus mesophilus]